jgi:hypothetical protein
VSSVALVVPSPSPSPPRPPTTQRAPRAARVKPTTGASSSSSALGLPKTYAQAVLQSTACSAPATAVASTPASLTPRIPADAALAELVNKAVASAVAQAIGQLSAASSSPEPEEGNLRSRITGIEQQLRELRTLLAGLAPRSARKKATRTQASSSNATPASKYRQVSASSSATQMSDD